MSTLPDEDVTVLYSQTAHAILLCLQRRRVYVFLAIAVLLASTYALALHGFSGGDAFDDLVLIGAALLSLIILGTQREKKTARALVLQFNVVTVIFAIALLATIAFFLLVTKNPSDFDDEVPALIAVILAILNRFF